jgi:hypothetical protein
MPMNLKNYKFVRCDGNIYSIPLPKWRKHLKLLLAYRLSLLKKKPLEKPAIPPKDIKLVAYNVFELEKLSADDCVDVVKEEIYKGGA